MSQSPGAPEEGARDYREECRELEAWNLELSELRRGAERSRERYRELFDFAPIPLLTLDDRGVIRELNRATVALLGLERAMLIGKPFVAAAGVRDSTPFWSHLRACLGGSREVRGELTLTPVGPGERRILVEVVSTPVTGDDQTVAGCRSALVDITAQRESEERLRAAEQRERQLRRGLEAVTRADLGIIEALAEEDGPSRRVLEAIVSLAREGVSAELGALGVLDDRGERFDPWVAQGVAPGLEAELGAAPRTVGLLGYVARTRLPLRLRSVRDHPSFGAPPAGHPGLTSFLAVPIRYRGEVKGILYLANKRRGEEFSEDDQRTVEMIAARAGVAMWLAELTRRSAAERAWLAAVLDQLPDAVLLADVAGGITRNAAAQRLTSVPGGDRLELRRPTGELLSPEETPLARAMAGRVVESEELTVSVGGAIVSLLASATPISDRQTRTFQGAVCLLRDVTPWKALERLRDQWSAMIAHDIRSPLATVLMTAGSLERTHGGDRRVATGTERIRASVDRVVRMVNDLLDEASIASGTLRLERRPLELQQLVQTVAERNAPLLTGHDLAVSIDPDLAPLPVVGDAGRLEQVLVNLLLNAARYGQPGCEIVLRLRRSEGEALITVENAGPVIPPEERARLFQRGYRTPSAEARTSSGLGLGLSICRGIVEAHGGRIWVDSAGGLTRFHFALALAGSSPGEAGRLLSGAPDGAG